MPGFAFVSRLVNGERELGVLFGAIRPNATAGNR
jgi:hypothetical protein